MKNLIVLSIAIILIIHNVFTLYVEILIDGDTQWEYFKNEKEQDNELSFTEEQSDIAYQFIFDSEFKNINANTNIFEEHKNLNSEIRSNTGYFSVFSIPQFIAGLNFSPKQFLKNITLSNGCKQALYSNLFCFRI